MGQKLGRHTGQNCPDGLTAQIGDHCKNMGSSSVVVSTQIDQIRRRRTDHQSGSESDHRPAHIQPSRLRLGEQHHLAQRGRSDCHQQNGPTAQMIGHPPEHRQGRQHHNGVDAIDRGHVQGRKTQLLLIDRIQRCRQRSRHHHRQKGIGHHHLVTETRCTHCLSIPLGGGPYGRVAT